MLTLVLPTGSEPGLYEVEIRDSGAVPRVATRGDANLQNQVTTVEIAADLGSLAVGEYQLAVRPVGEGWQQFPVHVR
jgi:hypothetical protein